MINYRKSPMGFTKKARKKIRRCDHEEIYLYASVFGIY